jgi:prevent-host-death family protein
VSNTWKLQDAKAQFSELVRRARAGEPQQVTVHGKQAVVIFDPTRFELSRKDSRPEDRTMAGFLERTRKYNLNLDNPRLLGGLCDPVFQFLAHGADR